MRIRIFLLSGVALVLAATVLLAQSAEMTESEYGTQAAALKADDVAGHFSLAKLALKSKLYSAVSAEADKLLAIDSGDVRAKYLKSAAQYYSTVGNPPAATATPGPAPATADPTAAPVATTPVAPTPSTGPATPTAAAAPAGPAGATNLSDADADAVYNKFGKKALDSFKVVQDTLLRTCGTDNCHSSKNSAAKFALKRERSADRKTLAENFTTVDRYINHAALANSTLLTMTLSAKHGGGQLFKSKNDAGYSALEKWVTSLPTQETLLWGDGGKTDKTK